MNEAHPGQPLQKPAPVDHPVHEIIKNRWSPRVFADRPVDEATLRSLFEAARWAPSSFNGQPWHFIVARREDAEEFERIVDCLKPGNQTWAAHAPVLAISVARMDKPRDGSPNRHAFHDTGLASAMLALQATALDLQIHMMAGFDPQAARAAFKFPENYEAVTAMALGYAEALEKLEGESRERALKPRERKPLSEFVFQGEWGRTAPLVA